MTAADLVSDLTQLLYVAAFVVTIVELARRRRRASVDAALFFGVLAAIVVTAQSLRYLQVSLSPVATTVLVAMLLALPYALGVRPRRPRDWRYIAVTVGFLTWLLVGFVFLRSR